MKRYLTLTLITLLFAALFFGCTSDAPPEEPATTAPPTTIEATTTTTTTTTVPVEPIDPDNPLVGHWITNEGGGSIFVGREGRVWAMLEFSHDTVYWEDRYNGATFSWRITGDTIRFYGASDNWASFMETNYSMQLNGNELRLDGILFTRYR